MEDKINPNGKPDLTRLPIKPLLEIAEVIKLGDDKYGRADWRLPKKMTPEEINDHLRAAVGHIAEFLDGEDMDCESGRHTLAHAAGRLLILLDLWSMGQDIHLNTDRSIEDEVI